MCVSTFSALTVTSISHIFKAHVCFFSTFFVTSNPLFSKAHVAKVTWACCLRQLVFLESESSLHFGIGGHRSFQRVGVNMNIKLFDVMIDSKLCTIRLHFLGVFLFYCFFIRFRAKMTRSTNCKSTYHRSFHIRAKTAKNWNKLFLEKIRCSGETGNEKTFYAFSFSKFGFHSQLIVNLSE